MSTSTVLLVDDDPAILFVLKKQLESRFNILEAYDPFDALSIAEAHPVDLAVIDVVMPKMMGWELCQKLKKIKSGNLPVIILTSKSDQMDELRSYESEADAFVTKPPNVPKLIELIEQLLPRVPGK